MLLSLLATNTFFNAKSTKPSFQKLSLSDAKSLKNQKVPPKIYKINHIFTLFMPFNFCPGVYPEFIPGCCSPDSQQGKRHSPVLQQGAFLPSVPTYF